MTSEDRQAIIDSLSEEDRFALVLPALQALGCIADGDLGEDIGPEVRDKAFDGFAALGLDRATRSGAVTEMIGDHVENSLRRALTDDRFARSLFGFPPKETASDSQNEMFSQVLAALAEQKILIKGMGAREGSGGPIARKKVPTFADATHSLIQHIKETRRPDHPDIGTIERVSASFQSLMGNKPVDHYGKKEIQAYVVAMSYAMPNFLKKSPGATMGNLKAHIDKQRTADAPGLSRSTLDGTYLDRVRTILRHGCDEADVASPLAGKKIKIPDRAAPKRQRKPLTVKQINSLFRVSGSSGVLSDVLLPLLGYMTGRRIGLLCHIRFEWLVSEDNAWMVRPKTVVEENGRKWIIPLKGEASLKPFVLHQTFVDIGLTSWMSKSETKGVKRVGWLFPKIACCADPADAAQKRMRRLFFRAGLDPANLESFHTLRSTRIAADFDLKLDSRVKRLQVGHELMDIHEGYAGVLSQTEAQMLRHLPLQEGLELTPYEGLDFDTLAARKPTGGRMKNKS